MLPFRKRIGGVSRERGSTPEKAEQVWCCPSQLQLRLTEKVCPRIRVESLATQGLTSELSKTVQQVKSWAQIYFQITSAGEMLSPGVPNKPLVLSRILLLFATDYYKTV